MYSVGIAYLLWLFSGCGALGFHRFYLGKIPTGLLWMCTGGLGMVGSIYDFFTLPGQVREANIRRAIYDGINAGYVNQREWQRTDRRRAGWRRADWCRAGWRDVTDGDARIVREKESVERTILRIAKENKGVLTASEVALAANISIEDAKRDLDALVTKGFAELRVRRSGTLVYAIPDMMDSDEPLEDF
jgi:TM2 domain-containing membrane protein YozV